ncbi:MAG: efflux RND transporter periplasmic adaptor subunit [Cyanobium sp.]
MSSSPSAPEPVAPQPSPGPPRRGALLLALLLLLGGGGGAWWWQQHRQQRQQQVTPPPLLPRRIAALGRVEPLDGVVKLSVPSSLANDPVSRILVKDGDQVTRGQPVAILESAASLEQAVRQSEAAIATAGRRIASQDSVIDKSRAQLAQAEVELRRYSGLYASGASSAEERDRRQTIASTTRATLDQAISDRATLAAELAEKQADLARNRSELAKATIRAPFSGTVFKIYAHPGDKVGDDGILDIGDSRRMGVIAEVYQTDRPGIALGQKAVISAEGFPGKAMTGTVVEIARQVSRQTVFTGEAGENLDRRVIEVKIGLGAQATAMASYINYLQVNVLFEPLTAQQKQEQRRRQEEMIRRQAGVRPQP